MKIITLHQPWASFISWGWKTIETRRHNRFKSLVGQRIAIHAGKAWDKWWDWTAADFLDDKQAKTAYKLKATTLFGCIICTAKVVEHRVLTGKDSQDALIYANGLYGLILKDIKHLVPIFAKGKQGIWNFELEVRNGTKQK